MADSGRPQPAMSGTELATSTTIKRPGTFNGIPGDSAGPRTGRAPGFSDLESLLSQKGPLGSGTKFKMPNNQLFEYDSAELGGSAVEQLQKVATLIKRNPKATFTLEGYTDSFGSEEYNLDLSERRAEAVKAYLVDALGHQSRADRDARLREGEPAHLTGRVDRRAGSESAGCRGGALTRCFASHCTLRAAVNL